MRLEPFVVSIFPATAAGPGPRRAHAVREADGQGGPVVSHSIGSRRLRWHCWRLMLAIGMIVASAAASAETWDVITFDPPAGRREAGPDAVGFTESTPTTFVTYAVYKSARSSSDPARDFQEEWKLLMGRYELRSELKSDTRDWGGGWKLTVGVARVWGEQQRNFTSVLSVFTGYGVKASILVNYNDDRYKPAIDRFVASWRLTAPGSSPAAAPAAGSAAPAPVSSGDVGAGFAFSPPPGFTEQSGWYVASRVENRGGGREITSALVRVLPAVGAQGNIGDALRALWQQHLPAELKERAGAMVYRRYVGDGVPAQFIAGKGRESGRRADTMFTLYVLDCGSTWQPLLVAQTYDEPDSTASFGSGVAMSGGMSFGTSAQMAEPFLAAVRCAGGKGRPLVDPTALVGDYSFGSSSSLQWVNVYTGAMSMTAVSYGGQLNLKPDGSYDYKFAGASGVVGAMNIQTDNARGRWEVQGDLLVLTRDNGKQTKYRIAGLTQFPSGEKGAVFMSRLDLPVNPTTVTNGGDYYATKAR